MEERVQKIISNAGYCSRRRAEELIDEGKVEINGKVISLGSKAEKNKDKITVEGKLLKFDKSIYILLNKPPGYICSKDDPNIKKNIYGLIREKERVYSVGRLDMMSEGLIILTNDGDFANKVMHPRYEKEKEYKAVLEKPFLLKDKEAVEKGIEIEDNKGRFYIAKGIKIRIDDNKKNIVFFSLHEGKNRVIRRILKKLDYNIQKLIRIRIGNIIINGLKVGEYRMLTKQEIKGLS